MHRAISDSEFEYLALARVLAKGQGFPKLSHLPERGAPRTKSRIYIGYLSVELHDATTNMIAGVFEHHDRSRFETTAIAIGADDGSEMRRRIRDSFDRFVSIHGINDDDLLVRLRSMQLDILIDLKGNAGDRRTSILARRAAPVQVSYLGYPGTMGVPFIDYIIADRIIITLENQAYYTEKIVYLPNSYMATDNSRPIATETLSRAAEELPETGFVFASFNYSYKISPEIFAVWMRLLHSVQGSVLWLRSTNPDARSSLRREARTRGIAPERIVFAPFAPRAEDYFARLRLAGLFLDTLPFNAHATAVDALWAGLPVVTCTGHTYAGRVAASLLEAIGLPELVTHSLEDYEKLALALAQNPELLAAIRMKLTRNRDTHALFHTAKFTRNLETAYTTMFERQLSGLAPEFFIVDDCAE